VLSLENVKWEDPSSTTSETEARLGKYTPSLLTVFCSWIEMLFNPRNAVEQRISQFMRFIHPYLAFITYRFHVEKAREIGK
jgi:hypothetical protein